MVILDIILLGILIVAGFIGIRKGFIGQATKLIGLILGIWGAIHFSDFTARLIADHFTVNTKYLSLIAFAITFTALLVGIHFLGIIVEKLVNLTPLGIVNKVLGAVFGILQMALIISVILILLENLNQRFKLIPNDFGEKSILYNPIKSIAPTIYPYLRFEELKATFEDTFDLDKHGDNQQ